MFAQYLEQNSELRAISQFEDEFFSTVHCSAGVYQTISSIRSDGDFLLVVWILVCQEIDLAVSKSGEREAIKCLIREEFLIMDISEMVT